MRETNICITIFLICTTFLLSGCKDYTSGDHEVNSNPINIVEMGFVLEGEDGLVYFQDGESNNNISRLVGTTKETYVNTYGMNLILYNNYLYYRDYKNGANLMRLDINNPEKREIVSDVNTYQSIIVDGMIYANIVDLGPDGNGLYRIDLDGSNKKKLVNASINCMQYESDYIYYCKSTKGQLFRIDLNGKNNEEILIQGTGEYIETTHFIVNQEWIYFNNRNHDELNGAVNSNLSICRVRDDGTEFEELADGYVSNIYNKDGKKYLLYINKDILYMMNLETKEVEEIFSGRITSVNVFQDKIYVLDWETESNNSIIHKINMENKEVSILEEDSSNGTK